MRICSFNTSAKRARSMRLVDRLRAYAYTNSCTCDMCGAELFEYYPRRLCENCLPTLTRNNKRVCPKCGRHTRALGVCLVCKSRMPVFVKGFSPFVYKGEVAMQINRMKNGSRRLAFFFGEQIAEYFLHALDAWQGADKFVFDVENAVILYVPLSPERERARGYNQARELALAFGERLARAGIMLPVCEDALTLNRIVDSQKDLKKGERMQNVKGAYHVHKRKECKGKIVFLIDDIMTTGATGSECAEALMRVGARAVLFFAVASLKEGD